MRKEQKIFRIATALSAVTQIALSALVPIFICMGAAVLIKKHFDLGNGIVVLGIVAGALSGVVSMIRLTLAFLDKTK